jgi:hypothetical protein
MYFFILTWFKKLHSQEAATSYLVLQWKSTLLLHPTIDVMTIIESTELDNSSEANGTFKRDQVIRIPTHSNKHSQLKSAQYFSDPFKLRWIHECNTSFQC